MGSYLIYHFDAICTTFNVFSHLKKPNFLEQFVLYMLNDWNNIKISTKVIIEIRNTKTSIAILPQSFTENRIEAFWIDHSVALSH